MYKCKDCGRLFEEPYQHYEEDTGANEQGCPHCSSDYFTEVNVCKCCEDEYVEDDFCEDCMEKLALGLNQIMDELSVDADIFQDMITAHFNW